LATAVILKTKAVFDLFFREKYDFLFCCSFY
jgi:hypothetical protein